MQLTGKNIHERERFSPPVYCLYSQQYLMRERKRIYIDRAYRKYVIRRRPPVSKHHQNDCTISTKLEINKYQFWDFVSWCSHGWAIDEMRRDAFAHQFHTIDISVCYVVAVQMDAIAWIGPFATTRKLYCHSIAFGIQMQCTAQHTHTQSIGRGAKWFTKPFNGYDPLPSINNVRVRMCVCVWLLLCLWLWFWFSFVQVMFMLT